MQTCVREMTWSNACLHALVSIVSQINLHSTQQLGVVRGGVQLFTAICANLLRKMESCLRPK